MIRRKEWNDEHNHGTRKLSAAMKWLGAVALLLLVLLLALRLES